MSAPTLTGLVDAEYADFFSWVRWFIQALPFLVVTLVGCYFANLFLYKPKADEFVNTMPVNTEEEPVKERLNS